ncbi:MAG: tripartite tricarboxylate transporter substrate binding protein [Betaproteobacteria bacterium]
MRYVAILLLNFLAALFASKAAAIPVPNYPVKTVRFIVPSVAGGGSDIVARAVAAKLAADLGQQIVVDNRAGGTGVIALELTANAAPDGHTILLLNGTSVVGSTLQRSSHYDVQKFTPIIQLTEQPFIVLVSNQLPVKNPAELIALAKSKPGSLAYGSNGAGSMQHLAVALLMQRTGIDMLHVPYKGGAQVLGDLGSGQIQVGFTNPLAARPHISAGRLRGIAVTTAKRIPYLSELPAVAETVPGYQVSNWYGVAGPPGMPESIVRILHKALAGALAAPDVRDWLEKEGSVVGGGTAKDFGVRVASEIRRWSELVSRVAIAQ